MVALECDPSAVGRPIDIARDAVEQLPQSLPVRLNHVDATSPTTAREGDQSTVRRPIGIGVDRDEGDLTVGFLVAATRRDEAKKHDDRGREVAASHGPRGYAPAKSTCSDAAASRTRRPKPNSGSDLSAPDAADTARRSRYGERSHSRCVGLEHCRRHAGRDPPPRRWPGPPRSDARRRTPILSSSCDMGREKAPSGEAQHRLRLLGSEAFDSGVTLLRYASAADTSGKASTANFVITVKRRA